MKRVALIQMKQMLKKTKKEKKKKEISVISMPNLRDEVFPPCSVIGVCVIFVYQPVKGQHIKTSIG